jgi:class 3 adenylate cyclase
MAAAIPSGTVTLLFTDIEGSTRLWESERAEMAAALRRHDAILRDAIGRADGFVFKTVGDEFCAAFRTPLAAVSAALDAQRALADEPWPTSRPVRVRMGLHTGVCEERDNDYFGPPVNRTARLEAIAHGGQVLLSGATAGLVADGLPDGVALRDLGQHRLKDLGRPEQVFQLEAASLIAAFPPLASLDNPELPNNLPVILSPFIGRDLELADVRDVLRASRRHQSRAGGRRDQLDPGREDPPGKGPGEAPPGPRRPDLRGRLPPGGSVVARASRRAGPGQYDASLIVGYPHARELGT